MTTPNILLVEDNPDDEALTLRAFKRSNIRNEITVVRDGAERIKELEALVGRLTLENRFFKSALQSIEELRQLRSASSSAASSPKSRR